MRVITDLQVKNDKYKLLTQLTFYSKNPIVKKYTDSISWKERVKMILSSYQFSEKLFMLIKNNSIKVESNDGYDSLTDAMKDRQHVKPEIQQTKYKDKFTVDNFTKILRLCKKNNVQLIVVGVPQFSNKCENHFIRSLREQYDTPFINYTSYEYLDKHPEWLKDQAYLNGAGAHEYTEIFFQELKKHI